jgi:lycopene beta-cyclase
MAGSPLVIAGGGLAGCLAALALAARRPDVPLLLVEESEAFGGNHIWSFFDADVALEDRAIIEPLIGTRWDAYDVRFPKRQRTIEADYNSIASSQLDKVVRQRLSPGQYRLGTAISSLDADHVVLRSGERLDAVGVIDARGAGDLSALDLGWQKFVGRELLFDAPHGLTRPIIMDATVDQAEGYRFAYCLPFSDRRMLVEDTYYSLSPALDIPALQKRIGDYVAAQGWPDARVEREEAGVLPVAMGGALESLWSGGRVARLGLRGGFFHPTTGYSLPDAVRMAALLAKQRDFSGAALHDLFHARARNLWQQRGFYRLLNRMLFRAAPPQDRYRVLQHFYRLDAGLIGRFYAGASTGMDKLRTLSGRPPVPVRKALAALWR